MEENKELEIEKQKVYENDLNYCEEYPHPDGTQCYVFFSSNGLYPEASKEEFQKTMIEKSRYEWKSMAKAFKYHKNLGKIIYVRDIYKVFYIYGISKRLDSIDKVIEELRHLTNGYEVTTVGISSGGYLSVICAAALQAKRAFCISGQFNIEWHLQPENLAYCMVSEERKKYIDILNLVRQNRNVPVYYLCPVGCEHDYENYQAVKEEENVKCFLFPDKKHAATVYPFNFPDLLFLSNERLNKLCLHYEGKLINKNEFYIRTVSLRGILTLISYIWKSKFRLESLIKRWDV